MTPFSKFGLLTAAVLALGLGAATPAAAEEEPFWAKGRPTSNEAAMKMAPVPAPPVPTAADQLPKLQVPDGFKVETFASGILDARGLREGANGTVFVSSLFVAGKIYAVTGEAGNKEVKTIASDLMLPNGIEYRDGDLYVATPKEIMKFAGIDGNLDSPPKPETIYSDLPGDIPHGWKFIKFGPDGKLYVPVGAPCNICDPDEKYSIIFKINADGTGREVVAKGVRNTVGFDFDPKTGDLWFGDNQRDWLSEDMPLDELNHVASSGQEHFGFPYCHSGIMLDPELGWGKSCDDYKSPAATLGPHAAPLGMRFYTGDAFPEKYQGAMFIARHGPWNRTEKYADVAVAYPNGDGTATVEPFLTGFVKDNKYVGRPADVLVMSDGSLLVSDDYNGAIYRITHE